MQLFDRGTSETAGVAVLILVTVVTTASVGLSVTLLDEQEGSDTTFNFDHQENIKSMLISYTSGDSLVAGNLVIAGPDGQVTWAQESSFGPDERVEPGPPGNVAVVLGESSAYGGSIGQQAWLEIRYTPQTDDGEEGETVVLATWNGGSGGGGDGDAVDVPGDGEAGDGPGQGQG
jgi:hypothetical protein